MPTRVAPHWRSSWRIAATMAVCMAVAGTAGLATLSGQNAAPRPLTAAETEFQQKVLPVLSANCMTCHNDTEFAGDFSMEPFSDPARVPTAEFWTKVLDKVRSGAMPPKTMPRLAAGDQAAITGWIERTYKVAATSVDPATADPGRVTARRLNRTEYNNTIRDLLGVSLKPADEFPVDDSGYGFDNIGDVLTMSPMLMEKYLRAARTVSRAAVFGEQYPAKPSLLVSLQGKKIQDDTPATGNILPFSLRGALYGTWHAPVDAEYEFRWRYVNFRGDETVTTDAPAGGRGAGRGRGAGGARGAGAAGTPAQPGAPSAPGAPGADNPGAPAAGAPQAGAPQAGAGRGRGTIPGPAGAGRGAGRAALTPEEYRAREERARLAAPPELMTFTVDGAKVYEFVVEGNSDYAYTHPDNIARVKLTAGDHTLRVSYPNLANVTDPTAQLNRDGRRKLFIEHMDIVGPFAPAKTPPPGFKKIFICGSPGKYTTACAQQIVDHLVTRAYRRPATAVEVRRLMTLVNLVRRNDTFEEGIRSAIEAVLISPSFLFRVERDPGPAAAAVAPARAGVPALAASHTAAPNGATTYRVSDYELASRLSYFLWSSMPDDGLLAKAKAGTLHTPAVLDAEVTRMLADPKANALVENFGEQWLNIRLMDRVKPDALKFTQVDDELLDAMRTETRMFLSAVFREDRSILDLIDGRFTFVNGPLARYYGIPGVNGEAFQRVALDGEQRSGLVTQASILSISSYATRTSPVLRGKWVLDNLLGAPPPPPPPNIPALVTEELGTAASMRQRLEQHRANPTCGACHNQMDPIGFALENYNAAGGWRTKDGNFDIDNTGTLPDGRQIAGSKGLKASLRGNANAFAEHFTDRLMTYALGRGLERTDRPVLDQIATGLASEDYRFSVLVKAIVNSRPFQMRAKVTP